MNVGSRGLRLLRFTLMRTTVSLLVLLGALVLAPVTWASGVDVIRDCTADGRIDERHGPQDYADALSSLPSDVDEYTDCRAVISAARRNPPQPSGPGDGGSGGGAASGGGGDKGGGDKGGGGKGGGGKGGGGLSGLSALDDSKSKASAKPAKVEGAKPQRVAQGPPIAPRPSTLGQRPLGHGVPTPLLITLIVLALAALGWLAASARGVSRPVPLVRVVDRVFPRRA